MRTMMRSLSPCWSKLRKICLTQRKSLWRKWKKIKLKATLGSQSKTKSTGRSLKRKRLRISKTSYLVKSKLSRKRICRHSSKNFTPMRRRRTRNPTLMAFPIVPNSVLAAFQVGLSSAVKSLSRCATTQLILTRNRHLSSQLTKWRRPVIKRSQKKMPKKKVRKRRFLLSLKSQWKKRRS